MSERGSFDRFVMSENGSRLLKILALGVEGYFGGSDAGFSGDGVIERLGRSAAFCRSPLTLLYSYVTSFSFDFISVSNLFFNFFCYVRSFISAIIPSILLSVSFCLFFMKSTTASLSPEWFLPLMNFPYAFKQ